MTIKETPVRNDNDGTLEVIYGEWILDYQGYLHYFYLYENEYYQAIKAPGQLTHINDIPIDFSTEQIEFGKNFLNAPEFKATLV